jgi:XTP/dITP diphosphohydrolase
MGRGLVVCHDVETLASSLPSLAHWTTVMADRDASSVALGDVSAVVSVDRPGIMASRSGEMLSSVMNGALLVDLIVSRDALARSLPEPLSFGVCENISPPAKIRHHHTQRTLLDGIPDLSASNWAAQTRLPPDSFALAVLQSGDGAIAYMRQLGLGQILTVMVGTDWQPLGQFMRNLAVYHEAWTHPLRFASVCLATTNSLKAAEIRPFVEQTGIAVVCSAEQQTKEPLADKIPEGERSYVENALVKARSQFRTAEMPVLADDSGVSIEALNGAPGTAAASFGGPEHPVSEIIGKIPLDATRNATVIQLQLLYWSTSVAGEDREVFTFHSTKIMVEITRTPRGSSDHAFDPYLRVAAMRKSLAEMTLEEKARIPGRTAGVLDVARVIASRNYDFSVPSVPINSRVFVAGDLVHELYILEPESAIDAPERRPTFFTKDHISVAPTAEYGGVVLIERLLRDLHVMLTVPAETSARRVGARNSTQRKQPVVDCGQRRFNRLVFQVARRLLWPGAREKTIRVTRLLARHSDELRASTMDQQIRGVTDEAIVAVSDLDLGGFRELEDLKLALDSKPSVKILFLKTNRPLPFLRSFLAAAPFLHCRNVFVVCDIDNLSYPNSTTELFHSWEAVAESVVRRLGQLDWASDPGTAYTVAVLCRNEGVLLIRPRGDDVLVQMHLDGNYGYGAASGSHYGWVNNTQGLFFSMAIAAVSKGTATDAVALTKKAWLYCRCLGSLGMGSARGDEPQLLGMTQQLATARRLLESGNTHNIEEAAIVDRARDIQDWTIVYRPRTEKFGLSDQVAELDLLQYWSQSLSDAQIVGIGV